jgi:hypothetical protein
VTIFQVKALLQAKGRAGKIGTRTETSRKKKLYFRGPRDREKFEIKQ